MTAANGAVRWNSLEAFYRARNACPNTEEYDFGFRNYTDAERLLPAPMRTPLRVSVVRATGDVYACTSAGGDVRLLGTFAGPDADRVAVRMDEAFAHWDDDDGRPLSWFAQRIDDTNNTIGRTP